MKNDKKTDNSTTRAVGRRRTAAARVRLTVGGGKITVNDRDYKEYFPVVLWQELVMAPLTVLGKDKDLDVSVKVMGGGSKGQAEAVRHGIARALLVWNPDFRAQLRAEGFLTRDPRAKERKKFGRYKARRGHQWRKR